MKSGTENLGERIRQIRKSAGLTQRDLGKQLGVGVTAVSDYETGNTSPSPESLVRIATLGNVTLDWLITGKGSSPPPEPMDNGDVLYLALSSKPEVLDRFREKIKDEIRDEQQQYSIERRHKPLSEDERELVDAYRNATEKARRWAKHMLTEDAQESREKEGGGSDSTRRNSA